MISAVVLAAGASTRMGTQKLLLPLGSEPLVRRDLSVLIRRLAAIPGIRDLALTTNGVLLPELAQPLYEAGLRRLNVHLDTLDRESWKSNLRSQGEYFDNFGDHLPAGIKEEHRALANRLKG